MHARFGPQPTVGVFARQYCTVAALDDRLLRPRMLLHDLSLELMCFCPAQIHAQYHLRPVLRLCATCTGLNIEDRHCWHPFRPRTCGEIPGPRLYCSNPVEVGNDLINGCRCRPALPPPYPAVHRRRLSPEVRSVERNVRHCSSCGTFLAERLRTIRIIPDIGLLEFALNFGQAFRFAFVVKDTPSTR